MLVFSRQYQHNELDLCLKCILSLLQEITQKWEAISHKVFQACMVRVMVHSIVRISFGQHSAHRNPLTQEFAKQILKLKSRIKQSSCNALQTLEARQHGYAPGNLAINIYVTRSNHERLTLRPSKARLRIAPPHCQVTVMSRSIVARVRPRRLESGHRAAYPISTITYVTMLGLTWRASRKRIPTSNA